MALSNEDKKHDRIGYNRGASLISKTPMKESSMSPDRQHHRKAVRDSAKSKALGKKTGNKEKVHIDSLHDARAHTKGGGYFASTGERTPSEIRNAMRNVR